MFLFKCCASTKQHISDRLFLYIFLVFDLVLTWAVTHFPPLSANSSADMWIFNSYTIGHDDGDIQKKKSNKLKNSLYYSCIYIIIIYIIKTFADVQHLSFFICALFD